MKKFKLADLNDVTNDINADLHQNIPSQFKKLQIDRMMNLPLFDAPLSQRIMRLS
jgi:hypothetical protein